MSASSPLDSLGDCVVCGTRTPTRCSECASNGTKWMYFCSRDHQKLIYKAHKRVCGKLSSPLRWPILNKQEVERYKKLGPILFDTISHKTFGEMMTIQSGLPYDILLETLQEPYDGDDYTGLNYRKFVSNALLRGAARSAVGKQPKFDGTIIRSESELQLLKCLGAEEDPFGLALNVIGGASPHIPTTCHEESWWEPLMHRYIIFYALSAKVLSCKEEDIGDDLVKCLLCSTKVIMELLETEVAQSHPQEAESLSRRIRTFTQIAESR